KKGVPIRVEIGMRDVEKDGVFVGVRNRDKKEGLGRDEFVARAPEMLATLQRELLEKAKAFMAANTVAIDDLSEFERFFTPRNPDKPEIHGGFAMCHWCGGHECEEKANEQKITIRCLPFGYEQSGAGKCVFCGKPSKGRVIFAKSY
ncbi:MAG: proline--tRNA ligase, partial [Planctomycetes bacterium]|nr:proline--tRNA ligase [Planctomycetota bacterium]